MIRIIGAPFDYSGRCQGSRMGPSALRLAGLEEELRRIEMETLDEGDVPVPSLSSPEDGFCQFETYLSVVQAVKGRTLEALRLHETTLVLGGDHSIALGSVSAALQVHAEKLAVLWIDAHADVNSPRSSPSGNLHGMPLAALMGVPAGVNGTRQKQWDLLLEAVVPEHRLSSEKIAWLGLRDIDSGERKALLDLKPSFVATMHDVDRYGIVEVMNRYQEWMLDSKAGKLWISFDVDCLDPVLAPGTGTAVRGGFTYREAHLFAELLREFLDEKDNPYRLVGLDVVETNPVLDTNNITARTAVEWTASLFGKTILGKR